MKKRLSALILAMLMILSICPVAMAEDAVSTASAYDVHITGNFVLGQTLTAHYSYYNSEGYEEDKSNTIYTWYYKANNNGNYSVVQLAQKTGDNTYVITSTETDYGKWGNLKDIYVSVSTADVNGNGEPVCSGMYGQAIPDSATTTTSTGSAVAIHNEFWAIQAHLVPKNYEGTIEVGDTLVARYTYQRRTGVAEGNTTFTWYRKDTANGEATVIQEASSNDEYTLTKEDIGKWIECTVTPYDANGAKGTAATTKIHYGNLGYLRNSQVSLTSLYALSGYPTNILLSDGTSVMSTSVTKGSYISGYNWNSDGEIKYDLGEIKPLDGVFFHLVNVGGNASYAMTSYKIEYSVDNETWYTIKEGNAENKTEAEYALTKTVDARYVRFTADQCHLATIYDFYPIQKQDAQVSVNDERIATVADGKITVKEYNESSADLLAAITATSAIDDTALETPIFVDTEGNQINEVFTIDDKTTAKLKVTGKNGVALEYALVYNKIAENLTVNCDEGIVSLVEGSLMAGAWKTPSAELLNSVTATSAVDQSTLTPRIVDADGNAILESFEIDENTTGKYVRFTNLYGDNYDYPIEYNHIAEKTQTQSYNGSSVSIVGIVDFSKYNKVIKNSSDVDETVPGGKYLIKTDVYIPDGYTVSLNGRQDTQTSAGWFNKMVVFDDATNSVTAEDKDTGFKFVPGKTYTVEFLIDYDGVTSAATYQNIGYVIWIDGVLVKSGTRAQSKSPIVGRFTPQGGVTVTDTENPPAEKVTFTNSTFRKVMNSSVHVNNSNNYALNLKSNGEVVKDIEQGQSYEFENTMGVYKGNSFDNYLAVFDVTYQDGVEVFRVLNRAVKNPTKIEINEGQEVRAFCFSDTLVPLVKMGEWK